MTPDATGGETTTPSPDDQARPADEPAPEDAGAEETAPPDDEGAPAGEEPEVEGAEGSDGQEAPGEDAAPIEAPAAPAAEAEARPATRRSARPRPVSSEVERRRDETVHKTIDLLSASPGEQPLSEAERQEALAELVRQARMQLAALRTEHAQYQAEQQDVRERTERIVREQARAPRMIRSGRLPLMYAEDARNRAEETVAEMNELFDRALARRAVLSSAQERYQEELQEAKKAVAALSVSALDRAWDEALRVLEDRQEAVAGLIALLDEITAEAVDATEAGAELSLEMNRAIQVRLPQSLFARTAAPISADSVAQIEAEAAALRGKAIEAANDARQAVRRADLRVAAGVSVLIGALTVLLWLVLARIPDYVVARCDPRNGAPGRLVRASRLLVPTGRALLLMGLWSALVLAWRLSDGWLFAGLTLLGSWAAYFLLRYALRELLAPGVPEFRIANLRDEAAQNLYSVVSALAFFTVVILPIIGLLNRVQAPPGEMLRALQVLFGAGFLLIGVTMTRRSGGLLALLPRPETRQKTALQHAGQLVVPLSAAGILGAIASAAGGYSNLSAFVSRSLMLEILLLVAVVFVDNLVLRVPEDDAEESWRAYARWGMWTAVVLLQIPIWGLHPYHATYAFDLLRRAIIKVEGAEVTGLSIFKGLLLVLAGYWIARFARAQLQAWHYLAERFQEGATYAVSSLAFYLIIAAGVVWGILASGFQLSVLTVFAGMAGIGLGFGLQNVVSNFVSGLILLIERPVAVGDFVDLGDLQGYITSINLRSTTIRTRDGNIVLVPNSDLAGSRVTNLTISDERVRMEINVGVSYDSDLRQVHDILMQAARDNDDVLNDPEPRVLLMDFGASSVDFTVYAWVAGADVAPLAGPRLRMQIWNAFQEHGIEIPFPQSDLHIRSSDVPLVPPDEPPPELPDRP